MTPLSHFLLWRVRSNGSTCEHRSDVTVVRLVAGLEILTAFIIQCVVALVVEECVSDPGLRSRDRQSDAQTNDYLLSTIRKTNPFRDLRDGAKSSDAAISASLLSRFSKQRRDRRTTERTTKTCLYCFVNNRY